MNEWFVILKVYFEIAAVLRAFAGGGASIHPWRREKVSS
jgi:hypothetical protein